MPRASRASWRNASFLSVVWAYCFETLTATAVETSPASTIAARKSAGSWKRSERNTFASSLGVHRIPRRSDLVAHAPDGHDRRRVPELAPELADVDVDGSRIPGERVAPDAFQQLVAREHEPAMVEQLPQEVELL